MPGALADHWAGIRDEARAQAQAAQCMRTAASTIERPTRVTMQAMEQRNAKEVR
jgi:hypothetical protein